MTDLPAVYVADPLAREHAPCPYCRRDMAIKDIDTVGGNVRRVVSCDVCNVRMHQEARPILGRRSERSARAGH